MKLLLSERPLVVLPSLAKEIGLNQAVILQQLHYWLQKSGTVKDGHKWVYNSMSAWLEQFAWIDSRATLSRYFKNLEAKKLIVTGNYNKAKFDKTKWYRIDYTELSKLENRLSQNDTFDSRKTSNDVRKSGNDVHKSNNECNKIVHSNVTKLANGMSQNDTTNTIDYTETTTENNINSPAGAGRPTEKPKPKSKQETKDKPKDGIPYKEIVDYLNAKAGTSYKSTSKATQKLIKARWVEGYKLKDFKKVIDNQAFEWQGSKYWQYMRPSTLFRASKFEGYLNANKLNAANGGKRYTPDNRKIEHGTDWEHKRAPDNSNLGMSNEELNKMLDSFAHKGG